MSPCERVRDAAGDVAVVVLPWPTTGEGLGETGIYAVPGRPGELRLTHRGVLFLDEVTEFGHQVVRVMRRPLEDGVVSLGWLRGTLSFPATFTLGGAMDPWRPKLRG